MSSLTSVVLIVCAAVSVLGGVSRNGPSFLPAGPQIVGGTNASEGEIPWQVSIQSARGLHLCGGSIINENYIVTAAHCSSNAANTYRVVAGTLKTSVPGSIHMVLNITQHERFSQSTLFNDIALWQVDPPFEWNSQTRPVSLPPKLTGELPEGLMATVSGWGTTSFIGQASDVLLKVEVPIVDKDKCNEYYSSLGGIFPNQICAGYAQGGMDQCQGDAGGPLFSKDKVLLGIVSWGNGCAFARFPGIYTEVSAYIDWIEENSDWGQSSTTIGTTTEQADTTEQATTEQATTTIGTTEPEEATTTIGTTEPEEATTTIGTTEPEEATTTIGTTEPEEATTTIGTTEPEEATTTIGTTEPEDATTTIGTTEPEEATTAIGTTEPEEATTTIGTTEPEEATTTIGTTEPEEATTTIGTTEPEEATTTIGTTEPEDATTTIGTTEPEEATTTIGTIIQNI